MYERIAQTFEATVGTKSNRNTARPSLSQKPHQQPNDQPPTPTANTQDAQIAEKIRCHRNRVAGLCFGCSLSRASKCSRQRKLTVALRAGSMNV